MWSTLHPAWKAAFEQAWEAYGMGSIPIGAVIVDPEGHILSVGRNRRCEQGGEGRQIAGSQLSHAEVNALLGLAYPPQIDPRTCTLYTTTEPCPLCCGALVMSNIRHVAFASRDPWAGGAVELLQSTPYLRRKQTRVTGPQDSTLESLIIAVQVEYFMRTDDRHGFLVEAYRAIAPAAVRLGETLAAGGSLQALSCSGAPAGVVIDELAERLGAAC